jgi:hypothetical protein
MSDERRRLLLARETWRSMHPSDMEVLRAAKRIANKFPPRKAFSFGRRVRMLSGAMATVAGIAYAGSGNWADITARFGGTGAARATTEEQVVPVAARTATSRNSGPHDPKEDRIGVVPERLAMDEPAPVIADTPVKISKKKVVRAAVMPRARRTATAPGAMAADAKEPASTVDLDSTWADVNAALGSLDYRRAESLLVQLSDAGHDADTRAKANLGLAQLAASRGDCERARVLALGVAAAPGIEMKTVRRALELAVRCAR